ncbi:PspC domain-containing protein [Streptomyces sp. OF3]|uniref:PspC domain-containing protein n=1 Tax=Streptomyces alkaliterrae TaxID=2213162 RepID=A0A7W3WJ70_9ACTN|nr:ATP-binding protein [Streptomyces alkaliterrae]MBB1252855.1 PspC domain-containing protein [Streptomyces alkaliterrae]MBB1258814.1 PspC domain-containing protein [Streptomyces alkaliterrae]
MTTVAGAPEAVPVPPLRKLYRSSEGRWLGGVARGLAGHLGVPAAWVRVVFVVLFFTSGLGALLYAVFWFVVPLGAGGVNAGYKPADRKPDRGYLFAAVVLIAALVVLEENLKFGATNAYVWPLLIMAVGVAVVWRQADNSRREHWTEMTRRKRFVPVARTAVGVVLVAVGVTGFAVIQGSGRQLGAVLQASVAVLVGIALIAGPYLVRMTQDLSEERLMRIRAQERAEVAAHVHDSVLHTLTLIQRNADNAREVTRLARAQERDLRAWLYKGARGAGEEQEEEPQTFAEAVKATVAEVEDHHGVPVEVVCVGDCPLDDRLSAALQAAREATVNAAKYGGSGGAVQVFAEVEGGRVFISVRDRGPGFDLDSVPADRMGVRESIIGRMERNGGTARIRSTPGEGTEVELEMERAQT